MPTRSPDVVTEHRITLGRWERENIKAIKQAKEIQWIGTGVGIAAVGVGGTYVAYKIGKAIYDWGDDFLEGVTSTIKAMNPIPIFTGDRPLPETPEGTTPRDDGWIVGGTPSPFQIIWESLWD